MPVAIDDVAWSNQPQFVVGLDIGTTHSSVTFSHLVPNHRPLNERVTHWPSVTGNGGSSEAKVASLLYYDQSNKIKVVGAAVNSPSFRYAAKKHNWRLVRYFKLALHPPMMTKQQDFRLEALPTGLRIERVYADVIKYMLDHTRDFFEQRRGVGKWEELKPLMTLVIAHPNGWGLREQERLRSAVVMAEVMTAVDARRRVRFVSEAEASVHYILWEKSQELQPGDEFIVCDAGGSTVDTTAYRVLNEVEEPRTTEQTTRNRRSMLGGRLFGGNNNSRRSVLIEDPVPLVAKSPIHLKELKASDCQPAGGVFVNEGFVAYLRDLLFPLPPDYSNRLEHCIQKAEESFEHNCKREFNIGEDAPSEYVIEMGTALPDYPDGNLVLDSEIIQNFFEEPVRRIIGSIRKQMSGTRPKYIFLVGGFGTSKYLRQRVIEEFQPLNVRVLFLDDAHGKAASDGSIIWYVRQGVVGRAARMSFGLQVVEPYDPSLPEHKLRTPVKLPSGTIHVCGKWDLVVEKNKVLEEKFAIRRTYGRSYSSSNPDLGHFTVELFAWTSETHPPPQWVIDPNGNILDGFKLICELKADLSGMRGSLQKRRNPHGTYWTLQYELCLEFGGVELIAYLEWKEKQMTKRSEAKIVVH